MQVIRINIDNREIVASPGQNILQVALENGIEIPHLCYDERIKPYGACGLCVVEVEGSPKLVRACSTFVTDGMVIKTDSPRVRSARKMALELILSDHRGDCRPPCVLACPAHTDCQGYVGLIANGQYREAIALVKEQLPLPASIGRVCPHPCETACRRNMVDQPVAIAELKRFVGDVDLAKESYMPEIKPSTGKKVAVVGAGPAGLTCAYFLAKEGHKVTIYEAMPAPGGMLRYGIPQYRLPKEGLDREIELIKKMGVRIKVNTRLGRDISLDYLRKKYDAVFLGLGAWKSSSMRCKGEETEGVLGGIDFLRKVSMNEQINLGRRVLVVGGGNTAMDAARTAVRLGAKEVLVLYRRTRNEMPAEDIEVREAEEEGVKFHFLVAPIEVISDGNKLTGLRCQKMRLGEPDASGRRKSEPIPGEEVVFDADTVISAIGQQLRAEDIQGLELTKAGTIKVDESTFQTGIPGVFAGGDAVTGPKIAIEAVAQGKNAARVIDSFLNGKIKPVSEPFYVKQEDLAEEDFADREKKPRVTPRVLEVEERKDNFREITSMMTQEEARREASRCLECGCMDYFECRLYKYINEYDVKPERLSGYKHKRYEPEGHPFIERNPDKCVLCGLCIRVCEEVVGVSALGLLNRGFETIVKPEFGMPLKDTACIACGQCADICPTGACVGKPPIAKPVPLKTRETLSVCSFCGVGCEMTVQARGALVFGVVPAKTGEGMLCARGRFGLSYVNDESRIKRPLVKKNGKFAETSWDDALLYTVKKLQAVRAARGENSIAIIASPRLTNEESYLLKKQLSEKLDTDLIGSFDIDTPSGLEEVFGYNASTNSFDELYAADLIVAVGKVAEHHPVMGVKLKKAVEGGSKLISINNEKTRAQEWAAISYNPSNDLGFFKAVLKALFELGFVKEDLVGRKAAGMEELKKTLEPVEVTDRAREIARMYGEARGAMIVIDENTVTTEAAKVLASMAVLAGKVGRPRCGVIQVRTGSNGQGAWDMGIRKRGMDIVQLISNGTVKAAVIFGEDPLGADDTLAGVLKKLEFLAVADIFMTATAENADVVLPLVSTAETCGTFTRSDRKIQGIRAAIKPVTGRSNFDVIAGLTGLFGVPYSRPDEVREQISRSVADYGIIPENLGGRGVFWPNTPENPSGRQVLYDDGFATSDGKARLYIPVDGPAFKEKTLFDTVERRFARYLRKCDLEKALS